MKKTFFVFLALISFFSSKAQLLNDFESWHNFNGGFTPLTVPNGWNGTDSLICFFGLATNPTGTFVAQVEKETPGNGGSGTALRVVTKNQDALTGLLAAGPMPCMASNSKINVNQVTGEFSFTGGTPFGYNPYTATMWVRTDLVGTDSTQITILALDDSDGGDSVVAVADTIFGANIGTFAQITVPFITLNGSFTTTKLRVIVTSSANFIIDATPAFANLNAGTWLTVDDISISAPSGVSQYLLSEKVAMVYSANNLLYANLQQGDTKRYQLMIFDAGGRKLRTFDMNATINSFDISGLATGNYIYQVAGKDKIIQSGKFSK